MTEESSHRNLWLARIKENVHAKVGDNIWCEDIWTEFVKGVAWWLYSTKKRNEKITIRAAAGLIKYGIETEDDLKDVAGSPPDKVAFNQKLEEEGVPPIVCDFLFNKYVHHRETMAVPVAVPRMAVGPPSTPRSKDISNQVASVFEGEVNTYLENNFQSVLPGCEFSKFQNREIDDGFVALEMDSFSYMNIDTLNSPTFDHAQGIYAVHPPGIQKKKPKGAPPNLTRTAEKYVVGESYSGEKEERITEKVAQLEEKLKKMQLRRSQQSGTTVSDMTSLFGAAILSFTCQSLNRKDQSKKCMKAVLEGLSSATTPILWRLAQAERLFIVVLSTSDGATTCALREIARGIDGLETGIGGLETGLNGVLEVLDEIKKNTGKESIESAEEGGDEKVHVY